MSQLCPRCGAVARRSKTRSWFERVRRSVSGRVPYRCRRCSWRGWLEHLSEGNRDIGDRRQELSEKELEKLEPAAITKGDDT